MLKDLLKKSRSIRRFYEDDPVPEEMIRDWVDNARYTPSTANGQTLKFRICTSQEDREKISPNLKWAGALPDWDGPEQSTESGVPTDTWVSAFNSDVALSVSRYGDMTVTEARDAFAQSSGYEFEDLMGGSPGDPLTGTNEKGEYLSFFVAAGGGADSYAVSWRYPAEAAEGFGTRLPTIAETFLAS